MNEEDLFITVNIFLLFLVRDNVDELALLSLAAGAMGGIGGAKLVVLVVDPFRYPVGSLFCELEVFSFELSSLSVDRTDNNFSQDIFENFCDNPFVDINEIEWFNERDASTLLGKIINSLLGLDRPLILRNFILIRK